MSGREHTYRTTVEWAGDLGQGTAGYGAFSRNHEITAGGNPPIFGSSDPAFRGDPARWNPEELLVASLSSCHQLWYLHLCAVNGIVVVGYIDEAEGVMVEEADGGGRFTRVTLRPRVQISAGDAAAATALHHEAHDKCFIARSVNFTVDCDPVVETV